jgi:hypothetical protein
MISKFLTKFFLWYLMRLPLAPRIRHIDMLCRRMGLSRSQSRQVMTALRINSEIDSLAL